MAGSNYLSNVEFRFTIKRLPNVEFYIQEARLPGISSGVTPHPTPLLTTYRHGDKIDYEELILTCVVDENMECYIEPWNWLIDITKGTGSFTGYKQADERIDGIYSDATLTILNSRKNGNVEINFKDLFPISVSSIEFDTKQTDLTPPVVNLSFRYTSFDIKVLT